MTFDPNRSAELVAMLRAEPPNVAIREVANQLESACEEIAFLRGMERSVNDAIGRAGRHSALRFDEHIDALAAERDALQARLAVVEQVFEAAKAWRAAEKAFQVVAATKSNFDDSARDWDVAESKLSAAVDAAERKGEP